MQKTDNPVPSEDSENDFEKAWVICSVLNLGLAMARIAYNQAIGKSKESEIAFRSLILAVRISLFIILCVQFSKVSSKNKTVNAQFLSNLFLSLYYIIESFPIPIEPPASAVVCGANLAMCLGHVAVVISRYEVVDPPFRIV